MFIHRAVFFCLLAGLASAQDTPSTTRNDLSGSSEASSSVNAFLEGFEGALEGFVGGLVNPLQRLSGGPEGLWDVPEYPQGVLDPAILPIDAERAAWLQMALEALVVFGDAQEDADLEAVFDLNRHWRAMGEWRALENHDMEATSALVRGGVSEVADLMIRRLGDGATDYMDVLEAELGEGDSLRLRVRVWRYQSETYTYLDLWFADHDQGWRLFDMASPVTGVRLSRLSAELLQPDGNGLVPWFGALSSLWERIEAGVWGEGDESVWELESAVGAFLDDSLPSTVRQLVLTDRLGLQLASESYRLAFHTMEAMDAYTEAPTLTAYSRLVAHYYLDNWRRVRQELRKVVDVLGWSSELYEYGAYAFLYEGERGKARRYSLKGLELNPNHWGCVLSFARAARKAQWPEVRALIEATDESHACYEWMISTLIEFGEYPLARQLVEYMAKETPDCENLPYFREYLGMGEEG